MGLSSLHFVLNVLFVHLPLHLLPARNRQPFSIWMGQTGHRDETQHGVGYGAHVWGGQVQTQRGFEDVEPNELSGFQQTAGAVCPAAIVATVAELAALAYLCLDVP